MNPNPTFQAARLVYKGLFAKGTPDSDPEYKELLNLCLSDPEFMQQVIAIAQGFTLVVVDVTDRGIVVVPEDQHSRFAMTLGDYRKSLERDGGEVDKGILALVQVAIAATFFPSAQHLEDEDVVGQSSRVQDVEEVLVNLCEELLVQTEQVEVPGHLRIIGQQIINLPSAREGDKRLSFATRHGAIKIVARHLVENGLLIEEEDGVYFPRPRYQKMLRFRAVPKLFELCQKVLQQEP